MIEGDERAGEREIGGGWDPRRRDVRVKTVHAIHWLKKPLPVFWPVIGRTIHPVQTADRDVKRFGLVRTGSKRHKSAHNYLYWVEMQLWF